MDTRNDRKDARSASFPSIHPRVIWLSVGQISHFSHFSNLLINGEKWPFLATFRHCLGPGRVKLAILIVYFTTDDGRNAAKGGISAFLDDVAWCTGSFDPLDGWWYTGGGARHGHHHRCTYGHTSTGTSINPGTDRAYTFWGFLRFGHAPLAGKPASGSLTTRGSSGHNLIYSCMVSCPAVGRAPWTIQL